MNRQPAKYSLFVSPGQLATSNFQPDAYSIWEGLNCIADRKLGNFRQMPIRSERVYTSEAENGTNKRQPDAN